MHVHGLDEPLQQEDKGIGLSGTCEQIVHGGRKATASGGGTIYLFKLSFTRMKFYMSLTLLGPYMIITRLC
jgi:hypothetical protein